jgi:hypothetical protein
VRSAGVGDDARVDCIVVGCSDDKRRPGEVARFVASLHTRSRVRAQELAQAIGDPIRYDRDSKSGLGKRFGLSSRNDSSADYNRSAAVWPQ